jgi:hypothetical protein
MQIEHRYGGGYPPGHLQLLGVIGEIQVLRGYVLADPWLPLAGQCGGCSDLLGLCFRSAMLVVDGELRLFKGSDLLGGLWPLRYRDSDGRRGGGDVGKAEDARTDDDDAGIINELEEA